MDEKTGLHTCPFCGLPPEIAWEMTIGGWLGYRIVCSDIDRCEIYPTTPLYKSADAAKKVWNTRYK